MLSDFCNTANAIAATTKKSEKERLLADYFVSLDDASLERAAVFFSGSPFPRKDQRAAGVGGATLSDALVEVTGRSADEVWSAWSQYGDAGDTAAALFPADPSRSVTLSEVGETFELLAATTGAIDKKSLLVGLLQKLDREGVRYLRELLSAAPASIRFTSQTEVRDAAHVDELFDAARARANEGLVVKAPDSVYTPGRRGKSWLKYKKALATLDCVVTAAEYGHGKRRSVLSDVTFAVRRDGELVNIGKAYSGLTDAEIETLTKHFQATTTSRHGPVHLVEPTIVLDIAFDRIQESARHKSGYALRFPRIAHLRADKTVDQISTIDEVRRIYEGQLKRERQE